MTLRQTKATISIQESLSKAALILGAAALAVLIATTVVGVVWRYLLSNPIFGLEDVASLSLAVVVAAGVLYAALERAHIAVDLLAAWLDHDLPGRLITALASAATSAICVVSVLALHKKASCGVPCGEFTSNLSIPHAPFFYGFALAFAVFALVELCAAIQKLFRKT